MTGAGAAGASPVGGASNVAAAGGAGGAAASLGISVWPVLGLGEIEPGADLAAAILAAIAAQGAALASGDIVVITQKVVSKAEGCLVNLAEVEPSPLALEWANRWTKDARVVELVLQ